MNKMNILKTVISLTLIFTSLLSCNSDEPESNVDDNSITADYISGEEVIDFYLSPNDEVYYICHYPANVNAINLSIRKIDVSGNVIVVQPDNNILGGSYIAIAGSNSENIYFITYHLTGKNIYKYSTSTSTTSTYSLLYDIFQIEYFRDETYILYDYSNKLKIFDPALGSASIVAGSGTYSIVDGIGINASFSGISKICVKDEIIYVIDGGNNLRKIEKVGSDFIVSTLVSNYPYSFKDISVNDSGELFVLVNGKGIYKLNNSDNSLEEYLTGEFYLKKDNQNLLYSLNSLYRFAIKNDNLYFLKNGNVMKISNYKEKFNL